MFKLDENIKAHLGFILYAIRKVAHILAISSLLPIYLTWGVGAITKKSEFYGFSGLLLSMEQFFVPSEILLYVAALLAGPLTYIYFVRKQVEHVDFFLQVLTASGLILLYAAVIYAFKKAGVDLNHYLLWLSAILTYIFSVIIWISLEWYQLYLPRFMEQHKDSGSDIEF